MTDSIQKILKTRLDCEKPVLGDGSLSPEGLKAYKKLILIICDLESAGAFGRTGVAGDVIDNIDRMLMPA